MRLLFKLIMKFGGMLVMVALLGGGIKYGRGHIMQAMGMPGAQEAKFTSEESDLMSTVFKSGVRLFSGSANRHELAAELSDKLYSGRAESGEMSELGIELVKPGGDPSAPGDGKAISNPQSSAAGLPVKQPSQAGGSMALQTNPLPDAAGLPAKLPSLTGGAVSELALDKGRVAALSRFWEKAKPYTLELTLVPVAFFGMFVVHRIRRRSKDDPFMPPDILTAIPSESEPFDMKHPVHSLKSEDFELMVARIYQRQGYRVSMPAGQSGGRGGDFTLLRKSERLLVQCKKLPLDYKVPVERVRELREALTVAGATRGMYVASCGFTWDARNYAKSNGITLINARTLDELIGTATEIPGEDLLTVSQWVERFMIKVELTTPHCPACEAKMEQIFVSDSSVWVCSQRPECRGRRSGRRSGRQHFKPVAAAA